MDTDKLKKQFDRLPIPEPSKEARESARNAALREFARLKAADGKKIKGFLGLGRLKGKTLKGGPNMSRKLIYSAGLAFCLVLTVMITLPNYTSYRKSLPLPPVRETVPVEKPAQPKREPVRTSADQSMPAEAFKSVPEISTTTPQVAAESEYKRSAPVAGPTKMRMKAAARPPVQKEARFSQPEPAYVGRDRFETSRANPVRRVEEAPVSTFSIDVDTASYAFVRRALMNGSLPQKNAVRIEEMINYFDYDYPLPADRTIPFKATVDVFTTPWNPDTKLLHIAIKGFDVDPLQKPRANLVFLIDVSGSMNRPGKLPLLKNAFRMMVETLDPEDSVAMVVYAGAAGTVLEPTRVKEKGKILAQLDRLRAGGSTAGGEGIRQAYALAQAHFDPKGVNRVILATDGDFNVGIRNPEELKGFVERKRQSGVYLTVLGFGRGNYNDALMQALAQNGNGVAAYIDTLNEARKVLVDEARANLFPIAKDVKIQVEFNPATVAEYRLIGYETRMLRREDFNNDRVDAGDVGAGQSVTAIYEITPVGSKVRYIEGLRYGPQKKTAGAQREDNSGEYGFLKIRYKLPDAKNSRLLSAPVGSDSEREITVASMTEARFASAVAAFGQLLRGDPYLKHFSYDDVIALAETARGKDRFGYRAEFLNLVRLAKTARAMGDQ